jgi:hypothetical protein
MIFLAVSSALFLSAYFLMQGQQTKTEFTQGMRDIESKLRDYINDVSVGYYPQVGEYTCEADVTGISFSPVAVPAGDTTGTNLSCIFLGKAIHVQPEDGNDKMYIYSVVGRRKHTVAGANRDVATITEATPTAVIDAAQGFDKTEGYTFPWGITVDSTNQPGNTNRMLALYSSLSRTSSSSPGQSESGGLTVDPMLYKVDSGRSKQVAINCIESTDSCGVLNAPFDSWSLCFVRADGNENAVITIGGEGKKTNLTLEFRDC